MVDPDEISACERECISSPDIFVVQIADLNVLNNNVLATKGQTLALDDTIGTNAQDGLVGANLDGLLRSLVVSDGLFDLTGIARVQQDTLALSSSSPACTCFRQYELSHQQRDETYRRYL